MKWHVLVIVLVVACGGSRAGTTKPTTDNANPTDIATTSAAGRDAASTVTVGAALEVTPSEAGVTIDDIVMGKATQLDPVIALAPGLHTLVIAQPGFKSYRVEFSVTDKIEKFVVKLEAAK